MKKNLLQLINKENQIRDCAVTNSDSSGFDIEFEIYKVPQFIEWKEAIRYELQAVSPDKYIVSVTSQFSAIFVLQFSLLKA